MRVLVTGGGGYLGCHLVPMLLERGHTVRVLDRFCFGRAALEAIAGQSRCEVLEGDVRRLQEHPGLLDNVEAVVHLAGLANDPSCYLDEDMAFDINVESTVELARQALERGVRRFVFASSVSVYGHGVFDIVDEQSAARPVSTFARTKLAAEEALLELREGDFEPVVSRAATLFGWSPRMRFDLAINQMVATAVREGAIEVRGGGNQWRPFLHVRDAARAMALLIEAPREQVSGEVFNVGCDEFNVRVMDLAERVARAIGDVRLDRANDDEDLRRCRIRFAKIRDRLGFTPEYTIDDGIAEVRARLEDPAIDPAAPIYANATRLKELRAIPAEAGGEPIAARFIPLSKPSLGPEEEEAVLRALRSGWLTSGPQIAAFERAFADTVRAPRAIAVSSCTAALHLGLVALGVRPGDEVITSPINWASTGNTILNMGAKIVFVDVDPATLNLAPAQLEQAVTERTRVVMPVHMAGHPCDMDAVRAIAARHGLPVLEDAAHALGAAYKGRPIGAFDNLACFSFYAIKNITTMEGGMITLRDEEYEKTLRLLAANGMSATAWDRYSRSAVAAPPEVVLPGYKYVLNNVGAAMGLEQIKKFPAFKAARARLAMMYREVLGEVEEIILPEARGDIEHAWHLFIIRLRLDRLAKNRNEIAHALRRENIGTGVHFHGLHLHQYYRERLGMKPEDCPNATRVSHEIISLPLHPQLTEKDMRDIVAALKKVLAHAVR